MVEPTAAGRDAGSTCAARCITRHGRSTWCQRPESPPRFVRVREDGAERIWSIAGSSRPQGRPCSSSDTYQVAPIRSRAWVCAWSKPAVCYALLDRRDTLTSPLRLRVNRLRPPSKVPTAPAKPRPPGSPTGGAPGPWRAPVWGTSAEELSVAVFGEADMAFVAGVEHRAADDGGCLEHGAD